MSLVLIGSTSGSCTLQEQAVAGTTILTLPTTSGTVVVSGTTPTLNGITFPATQVPSADANTLDDYEEGTFTPIYSASVLGTFSASYTTQIGFYVKIGNTVYVSIHILGTITKGTASGDLFIGGLPFATPNIGSDSFTGYIGFMNPILPSTPIGFLNNQNSTFAYVGVATGGTLTMSSIPSGATTYGVRGTIIYRATS
jgi:hypothetical protein